MARASAVLVTLVIIWSRALCGATSCSGVEKSEFVSRLPSTLPLTKVTLLGSHNAGAYTSSSTLAFISDCFVRNQQLDFKGQLEKGVRYFDIDLCYHKGKLKFCHGEEPWDYWRSHFFEPLSNGIDDLKCFLEKNPTEFTVLHFNRDYKVFGSPIIKQIAARTFFKEMKRLSEFIFPLKAFIQQNGRIPNLGEMRAAKRPLIILVADKIYFHERYAPADMRNLVIREQNYLNILWLALPVHRKNGDIKVKDEKTEYIRQRCLRSGSGFVDLQVVPKRGVTGCAKSVTEAFIRDKIVEKSLRTCQQGRCQSNQAANFVTIDYVDRLSDSFVQSIYSNRTC